MILLIGNFLSHTGATRQQCEELADRLRKTGSDVLTTSRHVNRAARLIDMVWTAWRARKRYRVAQVDVFSGTAFFWAQAVCWVMRQTGKPYVLVLRGGNLPPFAERREKSVRHLFQSAEVVVTPSRYLLEQMKPYCDDLLLVPNGVELSHYTFRLREQPTPRLVWLRAFHHIYNPVLAPQVVAKLATEFPQVELIMVGPDKGDGALEQTQNTAKALGVFDRIQFSGGVPKLDVPLWLNKGDIFINTTNIDNTPVSILEAMACGMCIVSTNVGGIPYLLEDERDSLLVPPDDADAMVAAVRRILTEPGLAARLSQTAGQRAKAFDWSILIPQWQQILEKAGSRGN